MVLFNHLTTFTQASKVWSMLDRCFVAFISSLSQAFTKYAVIIYICGNQTHTQTVICMNSNSLLTYIVFCCFGGQTPLSGKICIHDLVDEECVI